MTVELALYRAVGKIYIQPGYREIGDGEEFEYAGAATTPMTPLNAPARAAKLKSIGKRWREAKPFHLRRIAKSLGGFSHGTDAEVVACIEEFITRETESQKETSS